MTADDGHPGPHDDVGSVGEEAVKLLSALTESLTGSLAGSLAGLDDQLATGAPECRLCPICRTVHVVREAGPEVRTHLATAAAALMQAAAGLLAAAAEPPGPDPRRPPAADSPGRAGGVQHIDLDDDHTREAPQ